jgi:predicted methyltransferase
MAEDAKEWLGIANKTSEAKIAEAVRNNKKNEMIEKTRLVIEQKKLNPWSDRTSRINSPSNVNLVKHYKDMKSNGFSDKRIVD